MDRPVHAAPARQTAVGGVDDGVDRFMRDIALMEFQDLAGNGSLHDTGKSITVGTARTATAVGGMQAGSGHLSTRSSANAREFNSAPVACRVSSFQPIVSAGSKTRSLMNRPTSGLPT